MSIKKDSKIKLIFFYLVLISFSLICIYPVLRVFTISLRPEGSLHSSSLAIIPDNATFIAYKKLFTEHDFLLWLKNSLIVSLIVSLVGVSLASMTGYAFSRYDFKGRKLGLTSLLTTQMFPATMLLLPLFIMLVKLKIYDTFLGLIVIYTATALPFCIWQMKGYYDTIPISLEEAAMIDGCNSFRAFYSIILPLAAPALVITALFSFMTAWNEYLVAAVIVSDLNLYTLPLGLKSFQSNFDTQWNLYAASSLIVSIPVVVLFFLLSRWLISGLTLGSVKG